MYLTISLFHFVAQLCVFFSSFPLYLSVCLVIRMARFFCSRISLLVQTLHSRFSDNKSNTHTKKRITKSHCKSVENWKKKETKRHECPLTKGESNARSIVFGLVRLLAHILNRIFENAFLTDRCRDRKLSLKTVFSSLFQFTTISIFGVVHSFFSQT